MTTQRIANEIGGGKTKNSIIGKAHRLGLPSRKPGSVVASRPSVFVKKKKEPVPFVFKKTTNSNRLPPSLIEAPKSVTDGSGISISQLKWHSCRGIIGYRDGVVSDAVYCGERNKPGKSFCPYHASIFLVPPRAR